MTDTERLDYLIETGFHITDRFVFGIYGQNRYSVTTQYGNYVGTGSTPREAIDDGRTWNLGEIRKFK
jgi:hypothetical protein